MVERSFLSRLITGLAMILVVTWVVWLSSGLLLRDVDASVAHWQSPLAPPTSVPVTSTEPPTTDSTVVVALGGIGLGLALASGIGLLVARRYRRHTG